MNTKDALIETLGDQAEWRDRKAAEYPNDTRNSEAARGVSRWGRRNSR